jgi:hypothetical protein
VSIIKGGYNDPECEGNSAKYHTGKRCIESGCNEPAGTAWGPYWCVKHNVERLNRVSTEIAQLRAAFGRRESEEARQ